MRLRWPVQARTVPAVGLPGDGRPAALVGDHRWAGAASRAALGAVAFSGGVVLLDWGLGTLTPLRAAFWAALGGALLALFLPARVTAGEGWLEVRGPLRRRRVRTDALVSVRRSGTVAVLLSLSDRDGGRLELDPRVLVANPLIWHRLVTDADRARRDGTLCEGAQVLRDLDERVFGTQARSILGRAGL